MNDIYAEMQGVARELLGEFNQGRIAYVHVTPGSGPAYDPGKPILRSHPINGVGRGVQYRWIRDGLAVATDYQVTIPVENSFVDTVPWSNDEPWDNDQFWSSLMEMTPDMRGYIDIDDVRYKIKQIRRIPPGGTAVCFILIIGK